MNDNEYMDIALKQAKIAFDNDDVPVGAVIVKDGKVISTGYNTREKGKNAAGHAEINAIVSACEKLGSWRLHGCTMYVTLEPCPMCAGAAVNARVNRIVFGAKDAKAGALGSVIDLNSYPLNHKIVVDKGIREKECAEILSGFFRSKKK